MTLSIEIPNELESTLRSQLGAGLEQSAKEALAAAWFTSGKLSSRQVAQLLGISLFQAHAFLKSRGAAMPMTIEDVEADADSLRSVPRPIPMGRG